MKRTREGNKEFWEWFDKNLIYCGDTHSFVHRLYDKFKEGKTKMGYKWTSYHDAQYAAFDVIKDMEEEFKNEKNN